MTDNVIEDLLVVANPNPQRIGCPGKQGLLALVYSPVPIESALSEHVWHCSPCFQEFATLRDAKRARGRRILLTQAAVLMCALIAGIGFLSHRLARTTTQRAAGSEVVLAELNFSNEAAVRGGMDKDVAAEQTLPNTARSFFLVLPNGSESGIYDVEIRDGADLTKTLRAMGGVAAPTANQEVKIRCELPLPTLAAGSYVAAWRHKGSELWHYGTFLVK